VVAVYAMVDYSADGSFGVALYICVLQLLVCCLRTYTRVYYIK